MANRREIRFCREGVYYTAVFLAVLLGAVGRQLNLLMLVGCVLGGPLLFSLVYGRLALRRLRVDRKLPAHLHVDQRLSVDITLKNLRRYFGIWCIRVDDRVERESGSISQSAQTAVLFPRVAADHVRQVSYEGRLPQRGRHRFGPLRISTRFPLGLLRHTLILDEQAKLLVHPKLGRLAQDWAAMIREYEAGSQRNSRRGLLEADFYGLREWRTGDSRRWIHWRTSARRGKLIVRQFEQRRSQNLALLVDLWHPREPSQDELIHLETAISFVATLIGEACRRPGTRLVLDVAARESFHNSGPATPLFFREQMDYLALAEAHHDDAFPDSLGHALALVPAATPILIIGTRPVDLETLGRAASERDADLAGRNIRTVNVATDELKQYFHV